MRKITPNSFDIIFIDPPYASGEIDIILPLIHERAVLRENGVVIAEHSSKKALAHEIGSLKLMKTYKYGDTSLTLYRKERA